MAVDDDDDDTGSDLRKPLIIDTDWLDGDGDDENSACCCAVA
jgi:hypothetical protein